MANILIIDDKPTNRDVLRTVLGYKNHRVLEASDGQEGLELARAERPDLVIADILMPRMDGYEMVRSLRADPSIANTRVIFYTATYLKSEGMKLAQACGVSHLIIKPSDPQDILDTVNAVLNETPIPASPELDAAFDREHLRLMTDKLSQKVQELEDSNHRLIEEAAQRQRAEDALRSSEARMRAVLDAALDSIVTLDEDGKVVDLNPAAEALFGHPREAILGKSLTCFIIPSLSSDRQPCGLKHLITANENAALGKRIEILAVKADGAEFPIELTVTRILSGGSPMFSAYMRDLSEQKVREEMHRRSDDLERQNRYIQAASRLKSEFLANMSHELRTPLNAIIGFAQLMHDGKVGPTSAEHKEFLADILTSSRHLLLLINDVLDLSKVEAGKMEVKLEPVNLESIVLEVRASLQGLTSPKRIRLQTGIDPSLTDIVADRRSLKQVLYNYFSNAIKFTGEDGRITLRVLPESDKAFRLEVEDTGIGIAPGDIGKLFVEFQQLDNSESKKYPGTGLGLALTKRLVEAQGGHVGVNSVPGQGSVFFAVLPRGAKTERTDA